MLSIRTSLIFSSGALQGRSLQVNVGSVRKEIERSAISGGKSHCRGERVDGIEVSPKEPYLKNSGIEKRRVFNILHSQAVYYDI